MQAKEALADSRFGQMFEDPEFAIDKNSENYKAIKTTKAVESDEEEAPKRNTLNKVFSGSNEEASAEPVSFEKKLKNRKSDKIIKNYSETNKRMREKGNLMLQ